MRTLFSISSIVYKRYTIVIVLSFLLFVFSKSYIFALVDQCALLLNPEANESISFLIGEQSYLVTRLDNQGFTISKSPPEPQNMDMENDEENQEVNEQFRFINNLRSKNNLNSLSAAEIAFYEKQILEDADNELFLTRQRGLDPSHPDFEKIQSFAKHIYCVYNRCDPLDVPMVYHDITIDLAITMVDYVEHGVFSRAIQLSEGGTFLKTFYDQVSEEVIERIEYNKKIDDPDHFSFENVTYLNGVNPALLMAIIMQESTDTTLETDGTITINTSLGPQEFVNKTWLKRGDLQGHANYNFQSLEALRLSYAINPSNPNILGRNFGWEKDTELVAALMITTLANKAAVISDEDQVDATTATGELTNAGETVIRLYNGGKATDPETIFFKNASKYFDFYDAIVAYSREECPNKNPYLDATVTNCE